MAAADVLRVQADRPPAPTEAAMPPSPPSMPGRFRCHCNRTLRGVDPPANRRLPLHGARLPQSGQGFCGGMSSLISPNIGLSTSSCEHFPLSLCYERQPGIGRFLALASRLDRAGRHRYGWSGSSTRRSARSSVGDRWSAYGFVGAFLILFGQKHGEVTVMAGASPHPRHGARRRLDSFYPRNRPAQCGSTRKGRDRTSPRPLSEDVNL